MRKTHRYRRLFASELIKVDKETNNVDYSNDRAKQLNLIEKLETDKTKVIKEILLNYTDVFASSLMYPKEYKSLIFSIVAKNAINVSMIKFFQSFFNSLLKRNYFN